MDQSFFLNLEGWEEVAKLAAYVISTRFGELLGTVLSVLSVLGY